MLGAAPPTTAEAAGHMPQDDRDDYWVLDWVQAQDAPAKPVNVGIYNESTLANLYYGLEGQLRTSFLSSSAMSSCRYSLGRELCAFGVY